MVVPDASRSRHVAFLKQFCGFSTQVRNGICCRPGRVRSAALRYSDWNVIIFSLIGTAFCRLDRIGAGP